MVEPRQDSVMLAVDTTKQDDLTDWKCTVGTFPVGGTCASFTRVFNTVKQKRENQL